MCRRSAHERLFGTAKPTTQPESDANPENPSFKNSLGSLERSQNSKSDSLSSYDSFNNPSTKHPNSRIIPNAHDDLKTTLSKIDPNPNSVQNSPSKYGTRWDQNSHRHDRLGSKLDLKYTMQPNNAMDHNMDPSPRNSREIEKDVGSMDQLHQRIPPDNRDRQEVYR